MASKVAAERSGFQNGRPGTGFLRPAQRMLSGWITRPSVTRAPSMTAKIHWLIERLGWPRTSRDLPGIALPVSPPAPVVDAMMREAIAREVREATSSRRPDALLAVLVQESIQQDSPAPAARARAQRVSMIGEYFREVIGEPPRLHESLRSSFDSLRFPTLRVALADDRLFSDVNHPVRELLREAAEIAALAPLASAGARELISASLQGRSERLRDLARSKNPMLERLQPLSDSAWTRFLEQIRDEAAKRREMLERRARRIAAQELEAQIVGMPLPEGAGAFLRSGWVPMMASRLLQRGNDQPPWAEGMKLLDRLLAAIQRGRRPEDESLQRLLADAGRALRDSGLRSGQREALLDLLRSALVRNA